MRFLTLAALTATLLFSANSQAQQLDQATVEKIVADYIAANGDALLDSIDAYQKRQQLEAFKNAIKPHNAAKGPADAPITIVEFGEFQCPFCRRVQPTLEQLHAEYGDKIRFVYKHYTLPFHPEAIPAAKAAQAAQLQGKFWEYSKILWERTDQLSDATYVAVAEEAGLDVAKFNADRNGAEVARLVEEDQADASAAGARGTPYFLINGEPISGAQPVANFKQVIDAALAE